MHDYKVVSQRYRFFVPSLMVQSLMNPMATNASNARDSQNLTFMESVLLLALNNTTQHNLPAMTYTGGSSQSCMKPQELPYQP